MATASAFKQNCPSCDHPVPIKDPKMVGRKIDCPKCKYRFIVEKPADEVEEVEEAPKKKGSSGVTSKKPAGNGVSTKGKKAPSRSRDDDDDDDDAPRKKKASGGMSPIVMIGAGLGAVAVIGLVVAGLYIAGVFGSDESPKPAGGGGGQVVAPPPGPQPIDNKPPDKPAGPLDVGDTTALTNLLPNESEAVWDTNFEKLIQSPVGSQMLFDPKLSFTKPAFEEKFGFSPDLIARHLQAVNFTRDWYFNIIKVRQQIDMAKLTETLQLERGPRNPIEGFEYFVVKGQLDPFSAYWFYEPTRTKPLGLFKLDSTTLVLGDLDQVERFLELKTKPNFLSTAKEVPAGGAGGGGPNAGMGGGGPNSGGMGGYQGGMGGGAPMGGSGMGGGPKPLPPPPSPNGGGSMGGSGMSGGPPMGGSGMGGGAPMGGYQGGMGGSGMGGGAPMGGGYQGGMSGGPPMGGGNPNPGGMGGKPGGGMGGGNPNPSGGTPPPAVGTYMTVDPDLKTMLDRGLAMKPATLVNSAALGRVGDNMSVTLFSLFKTFFGELSLPEQNRKNILGQTVTVGMGLQSFGSDRFVGWFAEEMHNDASAKLEERLLNLALPLLALKLEQSHDGLKIAVAPPPQAENVGGFNVGGFGTPMGGGPPIPGGMMGGGAPMGGNYQGGMMGGGALMGGGFPNPGGNPSTPPPTDLTVQRQDKTLIIAANIKQVPAMYDVMVLSSKANYVRARGQSEMMSGRPRVHELAAALKAYVEKRGGSFPQAAYPRLSPAERAGRPFPPDQRISWLAEVVRFLPQFAGEGAGAYPLGINPDLSWHEKDNQTAATTLIPQFLGSRSTKDQWWVTYPKVDQEVAATQFVGVAGVGLDAAYLAEPTRMGVFGNDRVTALAQITDGPDKTIAVLQVPPSFKRPWLAGGGSTVQGVAEKDSIRPFVCAEHNGKRGTYAIMANGDVRFILETIPDDVFKAMCTIAGGEQVSFEEYAPRVKGDANEMVAKPGLPGNPGAGGGEKTPPVGGGAINAGQLLGKWEMTDKPGFRMEFLTGGVTKGYQVIDNVENEKVSGTYKLEGDSLTLSMPKGHAEEVTKIVRLTDDECVILDPKDKKEVVMRRPGAAPVVPPGGGGGITTNPRTANDLKQLVLAYHSHLDATKKPPSKIDDLAPYLEKNSPVLAAAKDGSLVIYLNVEIFKLTAGTSNTILGYEKDAPTKGGLVAMADGSVKPMTADEFKKATKPPGQ